MRDTQSDDEDTRAAAVWALGEMGENAAVAISFVMRLLTDASPCKGVPLADPASPAGNDLSEHAQIALAKMGRAGLDACLDALQASSGRKKEMLILTLGRFPGDKPRETLLGLLSDESWECRHVALRALRQHDGSAPTPVLAKVLAHDPDPHVRSEATEQLASLRAVAPLLAALKTERHYAVRHSIALYLGEIGESTAYAPLLQILRERGEQREVRVAAAIAMGKIGNPEAAATLLTLLRDPGEAAQVRWGAARGLRILRAPSSVEPLAALARDARTPPPLAEEVVNTLAEVEGRRAAGVFKDVARLEGAYPHIRALAAFLLAGVLDGWIDDVALVEPLEHRFPVQYARFLDRDSEGVSESAEVIWVLERIAYHGMNKAVRDKARDILRKRRPGAAG